MATLIVGIICLIVGAIIGIGIMALCFVASEADRENEKAMKHKEDETNKTNKN